MKITFLGASEEVTGSCYYLEGRGSSFLVDCGLFQGGHFADPKNEFPFPFKPSSLDAVFVTHAHLDHIGRLPKLVKEGFTGHIYMTSATRDLSELVLLDSVELMKKEAKREGRTPLFEKKHVLKMLSQYRKVDYEKPFYLNKYQVTFHDAGHILGSAFIEITSETGHYVFSGDLGNPPSPIIRFPSRLRKADFLVMESTYGGRIHEDFSERKFKLRRAVLETVKNKGVLLIPTFALERAQELLFQLNVLYEEGSIPETPIFIDSPLAIKATEVFKRHPELYNTEASRALKFDSDIFNFPGLKVTLSAAESRKIEGVPGPKVIIAGSGMMNGGRILEHAGNYLDKSNTTMLFVGFQAKGTLGRRLFDGAKTVYIRGRKIDVRAKIKAIGAFSGHADQREIISWIGGSKVPPQKIFITHGELEQSNLLSVELKKKIKSSEIIPKLYESFEV